jgi:hypothetical protein
MDLVVMRVHCQRGQMADNERLASFVRIKLDGRLGRNLDDVESIASEERLDPALMVQINDGVPEQSLFDRRHRRGIGAGELGYNLKTRLSRRSCQCWDRVGDEVYFEAIQRSRGWWKRRVENICVNGFVPWLPSYEVILLLLRVVRVALLPVLETAPAMAPAKRYLAT